MIVVIDFVERYMCIILSVTKIPSSPNHIGYSALAVLMADQLPKEQYGTMSISSVHDRGRRLRESRNVSR